MEAQFYKKGRNLIPFIFGVNKKPIPHQEKFVVTSRGIPRTPIVRVITKEDQSVCYPVYLNDYLAEVIVSNRKRLIKLEQVDNIFGKNVITKPVAKFDGKKWDTKNIPFKVKITIEELAKKVL
ncbi:MAG: hypothetical protein Q3996_00445 [Candidatus Saccharibacteria bacterium]|nr:hypothetical protein [Candidatus Saccharibacteria bacterium]